MGVPYVLMHMRGDPGTMQQPHNTTYGDVCVEVGRELQAAADRALAAGIEPWCLILDPGHKKSLAMHPSCLRRPRLARMFQNSVALHIHHRLG